MKIKIIDFKKIINSIQKFYKESKEFSTDMEKYTSSWFDFRPDGVILDDFIGFLDNLLSPEGSCWISYYCWECDFGNSPGIIEINGVESYLRDLDDLIDIIGREKFNG